MRFQKDEKLTEFERELLRADSLSTRETEKIANAPHLLKSIRARIEAEKDRCLTAETKAAAPSFADSVWRKFRLIKNWRPSAVAAAVVICAILTWQFVFKTAAPDLNETRQTSVAAQTVAKVDAQFEAAPNETGGVSAKSDEVNSKTTVAQTASNKSVIKSKSAGNAAKSSQPAFIKIRNANSKSFRKRFKNNSQPEPPREFYQLAFAGELEPNEAKQIVRVKLSPTALAALGAVSAPISVARQNSVTADLLLGEDGTPRAIRFVK